MNIPEMNTVILKVSELRYANLNIDLLWIGYKFQRRVNISRKFLQLLKKAGTFYEIVEGMKALQ